MNSHRPGIAAGGGVLKKGTLTTDADIMSKLTGSAFFVRADSEEEVWENLRKDPYYTSGEVVCFLYVLNDAGKP